MIDLSTLSQQLSVVELTLKESGLWSDEKPDDEALNSVEPFAIDTLTASQWLQWIFLPKMAFLLNNNLPLPTKISLTPYFEEALPNDEALLVALRILDKMLNQDA